MNDNLNSSDSRESHIVIFPGVFDPIHLGHISAAKAAAYYGSKLLILPERNPYRKKPQASYRDRLAMARVAVADISDIEVCDYQGDRFEDEATLSWLRVQYSGFKFVFLMGEDVLNLMPTWKNIEKMSYYGVDRILVVRRQNDNDEVLRKPSLTARIDLVNSVPVSYLIRTMREHEDVSSTKIKSDISKFQNLLPKQVFDYISEKKIYDVGEASSANLL